MSDDITSLVKQNMKRIRKSLQLTQDQVAERMGIPSSHYNRLELGKINPGLVTVGKIAEALGVSYAALFEPSSPADLAFADKIRRIETLPEADRQAIESVITMALERHQSR